MNTAQITTSQRITTIIDGSTGNLLDCYAYAVLAIYFSNLLFPDSDLNALLLNTAGIFAVGFFLPPAH